MIVDMDILMLVNNTEPFKDACFCAAAAANFTSVSYFDHGELVGNCLLCA